MIPRLQSLARRGVLRALRWHGRRQASRHRRGYSGPVAVGRTGAYLGRTARVDYEPPHGSGWHGEGVLIGSRPWEGALAYQHVALRTSGGVVTLMLPLSITIDVLP